MDGYPGTPGLPGLPSPPSFSIPGPAGAPGSKGLNGSPGEGVGVGILEYLGILLDWTPKDSKVVAIFQKFCTIRW